MKKSNQFLSTTFIGNMFKLFSTFSLFIICTLAHGADLMHIKAFATDHNEGLEQLKTLSKDFLFKPSAVPIDILIPLVAKDVDMLEHVVFYAKKNLMHPIGTIYIVAPHDELIIAQAKILGCRFVDETTVLPIQKQDITYFSQGMDRRGWLLQQLLKLNCDEICTSDHVLILDADTLLTRPQAFLQGPYTIFNCSDEYHPPYFNCYERLLQKKTTSPFSFVCHHMLFERSKLKKLKSSIEDIHQKKWYHAIMETINQNEPSGFSEYETYANFFISHYPEEFVLLYFFNIDCRKNHAENYLKKDSSSSIDQLPPEIKSISFHAY